MREKLPDERVSDTIHFTVMGEDGVVTDGYLQPGFYPDGRLGEVFIRIAKDSKTNSDLEAWAMLFSLALQHGVPVDEMCGKFIGWHGQPSGRVSPPELVLDGTQNMPMCLSIVDLACRVLRKRYGAREAVQAKEGA